jgi:nucleoside-diphosphate-sugar epimerase
MQTAVIGAGYIGSRVVERLADGETLAYGRSPAPGRTALDLDSDRLSIPPGASRRILYTVPPAAADTGDPRLARLLAALNPAPERFVYLSTSGVYGDCGGALVGETRDPSPGTDRAIRRHAAEQLLQSWCSKSAVRCIIFRVPGIYGPGRLGIDKIRAGAAFLRESEANPGNRIHADDLASAILIALERNIPAGTYNIADGDCRSNTWFATTVARLAGLSAPRLISRDEAQQTLPATRMSFLGESRRLDTRKMHQVLGFDPTFANAEDGIRASLRQDGLLSKEI